MYALKKIETEGIHYLELLSPNGKSKAQICLTQGGRLSNLVFKDVQILANLDVSTYKDNYASSILFPFANRIKDGEYAFNNVKYKLNCNEADKNNAIHGLVYNKIFYCINEVLTADYALVTLRYIDEGKCEGFPFTFNIELVYKLSESGLSLTVKVINEDEKMFPFTIGWHPYFESDNLDNSSINFKSHIKYLFDNQQIVSGTRASDTCIPFQLKNLKLDDSYLLESNEVEFITPKYNFKITTTSKENYLQLYTPKQTNIIAIEPMTGAANNFNNKIGLQTLNPNDFYEVVWDLAIEILN